MVKIKISSAVLPVYILGAIFIAILTVMLAACGGGDRDMLKDLKVFETQRYEGEELSEERIRELNQGIKQYEEIVNRRVEASAQLGEYYKMLGIEFVRRDMYGEALKYLEKALEYYPENEVIFYLCAASSARLAKAKVNKPAEQERLFEEAENYYLRAIELDNNFSQALYGISVLYIFELDRISDAEPYVNRLLEKETKNTPAMFLLARVYVHQGRIEEAAAVYDAILDEAQSREEKERARENKEKLLEGAYE
jgi:tetratricopeptide (TPR) repeat protein